MILTILFFSQTSLLLVGTSAVKALLTPAYAKLKNAPKVTTEDEATQLLQKTQRFAFFLRVDRGDSITLTSGSSSGGGGAQTKTKAKVVTINQMQMFAPEHYYAWFYEGSQWTTYLGGAAMVVVLLVGVMFPLWPPIMRQGVSYLSMGVLGLIGLFFVVAILRLVFWLITIVVVSPGIWIFPNLFADCGFVSSFISPLPVVCAVSLTRLPLQFESFVPWWDWDIKKKKEKKKKSEKSGKKSKTGSGADTPNDSLAVPKATGGGLTTDSDNSRPASRNGPTIEEVEDEDD